VKVGGRRKKVVADLSNEPGLPPGRIVLVLAIVVGCFGILWPRIFSPLLFGDTPPQTRTDEDAILADPANPSRGFLNPNMKEGGPPGKGRPPLPVRTIDKEWKGRGGPMPGMRPTMGGPGIQPTQNKTGGTLGVLMPMYTIAIIVFFVYTTFKVMSKKKDEEDEEEEVDEKLFAENIKYDEEYYNNYIKNYLKDGRAKEEKLQQEEEAKEVNLTSGQFPNLQKLLKEKEEDKDKSLSEVESDGEKEIEDEDNKETENVEEKAQYSKVEDVTENTNKNQEKVVEENKNNDKDSSLDPRDLEIQLLKARLEQTEAALERIVAHMGSVTARLAQGGQGGKEHCCAHSQEDGYNSGLDKDGTHRNIAKM